MKVIADLHIHSPYSRATSKNITIENLEKNARIKGLNLLSAADFTHPMWLEILKEKLTEDSSGTLKTETGFNFLLSTEISNIYSQEGKKVRIHNLILAPSFEVVEQINSWLSAKGRLDYDGRPIFGFGCPELVENLMGISKKIMVIPAHCLTPWFSVFGSKSGFNTVEECFQDQTKHIKALETGLSADPSMIYRVSKWDGFTPVSSSDSHSPWPWRIGREATVFDLKELTYDSVTKAIKTRKGLTETFEFFPEEGKYHLDGHRKCDVVMEPKEAEENNNICPVCLKPLTKGVLHRVEELADRPEGFVPKNAIPFKSLVPLSEIISYVLGSQLYSNKVRTEHSKLIQAFGNELSILLEVPRKDLVKETDPKVADAIIKVREGKATIQPGYDGVYGQLILDQKSLKHRYPEGEHSPRYEYKKQKSLAEYT